MARVELPSKDEVPSNNEEDKKAKAKQNAKALEELRADPKSSYYKAKRRKKNFVEEGASEMKSFVIDSVVMPTVKEMVFNIFSGIFDIIKDSIEAKIFGVEDVREKNYRKSYNSRKRRSGRDRREYNSIYDTDTRSSRYRERARDVMDYEDFYFTEIFLADRCLQDMFDIFEDRGGMLKVSDYKKLLDYDPEDITYIDQEWGWYSLASATVKPIRGGGFKIDMPRPRPLN